MERKIVEDYQHMVYGIALNRVGSKFDADDVFQEVFLIYFQKRKDFQDEEHRRAWLIKTTLNCCKRAVSNTWKKKTVLFEDIPLTSISKSPELTYQFESREENSVFTTLRGLPEKYRMVLHLFYFESFTTDEIASAMGITPPAVRMRLKRGRDMMREKLKGEYDL
ncbi:MAG: sigma-70 family RNA polymerase sigma factor [Oscillospiraceae bacterium]|nr:sigma-70 family RNA polymerase sigma factor [Oscillospiraceae bacterium]